MGQLDDFSLDQVAGASALIISSIGGLLLIVFKSRCKTISCCWGMWSCIREVNDEEEESDEEKVIPEKKEEEPIIQEPTIQD
tara:strand:- start:332 stop:577 length:246 start_codon:yes stop_codon:yes gene_type:complete